MAATHKVQIAFTDRGLPVVRHYCTVEVGGHAVTHHEDVELATPGAVATWLQGVIDANRAEVERRAVALAIRHAAAVNGDDPGPNVKRVKVGGGATPTGGAEVKPQG